MHNSHTQEPRDERVPPPSHLFSKEDVSMKKDHYILKLLVIYHCYLLHSCPARYLSPNGALNVGCVLIKVSQNSIWDLVNGLLFSHTQSFNLWERIVGLASNSTTFNNIDAQTSKKKKLIIGMSHGLLYHLLLIEPENAQGRHTLHWPKSAALYHSDPQCLTAWSYNRGW